MGLIDYPEKKEVLPVGATSRLGGEMLRAGQALRKLRGKLAASPLGASACGGHAMQPARKQRVRLRGSRWLYTFVLSLFAARHVLIPPYRFCFTWVPEGARRFGTDPHQAARRGLSDFSFL